MAGDPKHQRFLEIISRLDAISRQGWELPDEKIRQMAAAVIEELGYDTDKGTPKPTSDAILNADRIIVILDLDPEYAGPSVEGGVAMNFKNGRLGAFVECYNDGEIGYALTFDGKTTRSVDLLESGMNILDFVLNIRNHLRKTS